jgi:hypothetical protein
MTEEEYSNAPKTARGSLASLDSEIEDGIDNRINPNEDQDNNNPSFCSGFFECFLGRPNVIGSDSEVEKQHVRDLYFSFGVVLVVLLAGIILPRVAYRIGYGVWMTQSPYNTEKIVGLEAHSWLAFVSLIVLIIQAATGPLLNNKTYGHILKRIHTVDGWFGVGVLAALTVSGCVMAIKYWLTPKPGFGLGQFAFGIMIFGMVVGGAVSVKLGRIDVHKDVMFGVISWSFFGAGVPRWLPIILKNLSGGCYGPILSNIQPLLNYCVFQPLLLGVVYYRAGRLSKWWNIAIIAGSFATAVASWIGNAIKYGGNYPGACDN